MGMGPKCTTRKPLEGNKHRLCIMPSVLSINIQLYICNVKRDLFLLNALTIIVKISFKENDARRDVNYRLNVHTEGTSTLNINNNMS